MFILGTSLLKTKNNKKGIIIGEKIFAFMALLKFKCNIWYSPSVIPLKRLFIPKIVSKGDGDSPVMAKNRTNGLLSKEANNKNKNKNKTL